MLNIFACYIRNYAISIQTMNFYFKSHNFCIYAGKNLNRICYLWNPDIYFEFILDYRIFTFFRCDASGIRVLVPGAGLGRLAFDIAQQGFCCQGNEFSFYMLFTAHFILNR